MGLIQRGGDVCIQMLENVQQKTMEPLIKKALIPDTLIYTDEYNIYGRLEAWGYAHAVVHHGQGEFARDDDQDGFCEVHVNTIEGFWSLLRSWLRPHRGISQEKLPLYLGFFEFVHLIPLHFYFVVAVLVLPTVLIPVGAKRPLNAGKRWSWRAIHRLSHRRPN